MKMTMDSLIKQFNAETNISVSIDSDISLKVISEKRDQIRDAIKQLKRAEKMLTAIHHEYTLSLEQN